MTTPPVLLRMQGVSKRFGATQALADVSLDVHAGEILALIGENGAGKSTLMKILSGVYAPDAGSIELNGQPYRPNGPGQAIKLGAAMIYQELNLAPDLSVEDNVMLGQERKRLGLLRRSEQRKLVRAALARLGRSDLRLDAIVGRLSVGTQQIVEIARALVQDAKVIIFDEPTSSLAAGDVKSLFQVVRSLKAAGLGVVYISHFLEEISELCDRYVVLRDGRVAGTGQVADVSEAEIVRLMVGRSVDQLYPHVPHQRGETLLEVTNLTGRDDFPSNVSFTVARGEILGIAGLVGAGRTEVLRAILALEPVVRGQVKVRALQPAMNPTARNRAGVGLVSEDRKGEGLAQTRSIADNLTYSRLSPYSFWGVLGLTKRRQAVREWMTKLQVKARSPEQAIAELSGGNQQKVAIARVMHQDADVLLLDEPTRGIDVGTKAEIYRLIGELAAAGKAIVFVSSYLGELLATCDRVGVMSRGKLKEIRPAAEWTEETALACAVGSDERA